MTPEVARALRHVRQRHEKVRLMVVTPEEKWLFMTADGDAPEFDDNIDTQVIQDAVDSITDLPYVAWVPDEDQITDTNELRLVFGDEYPYACDAVAYYVFGESGDDQCDNTVVKAMKGVYGYQSEIMNPQDMSAFMLEYETTWWRYLNDIDDVIMNWPVGHDDQKIKDFF